MLKVVFLLGYGRSGSTFLGSVLGEIDGFFYGGELRHLWSRGLVGGWTCGCGRLVTDCPLWSDVAPVALGDADPGRVVQWRDSVARWRNLPKLLRRNPWPDRDSLADVVGRMYRTLAEVTASEVIVDSSKNPVYGAFVGGLPDIETHYVHLVRDPRAVAFSWGRRRRAAGARSEQMPRYGPAASARAWDVWNVASGFVARKLGRDRSLSLRYEDLVARPRASVGRILQPLGRSEADAPFVDERTVHVGDHHTVSGNPDRFRTGDVEIRSDDEWLRAQRPRDRRVVTAITLPLLSRYGYPVRVRPPDGGGR